SVPALKPREKGTQDGPKALRTGSRDARARCALHDVYLPFARPGQAVALPYGRVHALLGSESLYSRACGCVLYPQALELALGCGVGRARLGELAVHVPGRPRRDEREHRERAEHHDPHGGFQKAPGGAALFLEVAHDYVIVSGMFDLFGKNRDRNTRIFAALLGVVVIVSMVF